MLSLAGWLLVMAVADGRDRRYKLRVLDVDGTLLTSQAQISPHGAPPLFGGAEHEARGEQEESSPCVQSAGQRNISPARRHYGRRRR